MVQNKNDTVFSYSDSDSDTDTDSDSDSDIVVLGIVAVWIYFYWNVWYGLRYLLQKKNLEATTWDYYWNNCYREAYEDGETETNLSFSKCFREFKTENFKRIARGWR